MEREGRSPLRILRHALTIAEVFTRSSFWRHETSRGGRCQQLKHLPSGAPWPIPPRRVISLRECRERNYKEHRIGSFQIFRRHNSFFRSQTDRLEKKITAFMG